MAQASFGEPVHAPAPRPRQCHARDEREERCGAASGARGSRQGGQSQRPPRPRRPCAPSHPTERASSPEGLPLQSTGAWESLKHHLSPGIVLIWCLNSTLMVINVCKWRNEHLSLWCSNTLWIHLLCFSLYLAVIMWCVWIPVRLALNIQTHSSVCLVACYTANPQMFRTHQANSAPSAQRRRRPGGKLHGLGHSWSSWRSRERVQEALVAWEQRCQMCIEAQEYRHLGPVCFSIVWGSFSPQDFEK